jgi:orotidine-5'-phosphate decarboxylase
MSSESAAETAAPAAKAIPARERLIVPLDVPTFAGAQALVETLGDSVGFYKVGLELLLAAGPGYASMVDWLLGRDKQVMVDVKIFDIARTTAAAVKQLTGQGVTFVTVHGTDEIVRAAVEARGGDGLKVLAVTVLTSFDQQDLEDLGFPHGVSVEQVVLSRARRALQIGCDGIISSGLEAAKLRGSLGRDFLIVVPGVRPGVNREQEEARPFLDDQKRVVSIEEAFANGADYVVVGRPIHQAADQRAAAEAIQRRIAAAFSAGPPART